MTLDPKKLEHLERLVRSKTETVNSVLLERDEWMGKYEQAQQEIAALKAELTQTREERSAAIKELGEYARKCGRLEVDLERFQWRPIEEAPKDGKTKLLLGATWMKSFNDCVEDALHFVECEWWEETSKNTKKRRTERRLYLVEHQFECSYTHFMPIPTPPAEANHG